MTQSLPGIEPVKAEGSGCVSPDLFCPAVQLVGFGSSPNPIVAERFQTAIADGCSRVAVFVKALQTLDVESERRSVGTSPCQDATAPQVPKVAERVVVDSPKVTERVVIDSPKVTERVIIDSPKVTERVVIDSPKVTERVVIDSPKSVECVMPNAPDTASEQMQIIAPTPLPIEQPAALVQQHMALQTLDVESERRSVGTSPCQDATAPQAPKVAERVVVDSPKVAERVIIDSPKVTERVVIDSPKVAERVIIDSPKVTERVVIDSPKSVECVMPNAPDTASEQMQIIAPTPLPIELPAALVQQHMAMLAPADATRVFVAVAEAVADAVLVSSGFVNGEGRMLVRLQPEVLNGSELQIVAKGGTLTVVVNPATPDVQTIVEANRAHFEQHLAEMVNSWRVSVAVRRGVKENERV